MRTGGFFIGVHYLMFPANVWLEPAQAKRTSTGSKNSSLLLIDVYHFPRSSLLIPFPDLVVVVGPKRFDHVIVSVDIHAEWSQVVV